MDKKLVQISCYIELSLYRQLKIQLATEGITLSALLRRLLTKYLLDNSDLRY